MYSGTEKKGVSNDGKGSIIDYDEISRITKYNSFCSGDSSKEGDDLKSTSYAKGSGLWITSSYFNHSCVPNTYAWYMGDVMIRVSNQFIRKGEEVTLPYIVAEEENEPTRREKLLFYGITCKCPLCKLESGLDHKSLSVLEKEFKMEFTPKIREIIASKKKNVDSKLIVKLEKLIDSMKKIYEKNSQDQFMFKLVSPMSALALLCRFKREIKKSVEIYEFLFRICSNITSVDSWLNGIHESNELVHYSPNLLPIIYYLILGYQDMGDLKMAEKWLAVQNKMNEINGNNLKLKK